MSFCLSECKGWESDLSVSCSLGAGFCTARFHEVRAGSSVVMSDVSLLSKASGCGHVTVCDLDGYAAMNVLVSLFGDVASACSGEGLPEVVAMGAPKQAYA